MASFGDLQVSGCSQGNFKCEWTIKLFSSLDSQVGKYYESQSFSLEDNCPKWSLRVYPGGSTEYRKGYVSIFVHKNDKRCLMLKYTLSLRTAKGESLFERSRKKFFVFESSGYGCAKTIKASDLFEKILDGSLVIAVDVTYCVTHVENGSGIYRDVEMPGILKLIDDFNKLWTSKENTDCVVSVGGKDIPAHVIVLCARSRVFSAMFKDGTLEKDSRRVEITDFEENTIVSLMEFIYSGLVSRMDFDLALELLRAADKYGVSDLQSYCSNFVLSFLNHENVCQILVSADMYNAGKLRGHALDYFKENMSEVFFESQRSIFQSRPNLLCDIVRGFIRDKVKQKPIFGSESSGHSESDDYE